MGLVGKKEPSMVPSVGHWGHDDSKPQYAVVTKSPILCWAAPVSYIPPWQWHSQMYHNVAVVARIGKVLADKGCGGAAG